MLLSRQFTTFLAAAVWVCAAVGTPAWAHDETTLDAMVSAHGGQLRMAGVYHFELVVAAAPVAGRDVPVHVYLTDHLGQKMSSAQASGSVSFVTGKTASKVVLAPDGDNGLTGLLAQMPKPGTQATVSIAPLRGQAPLQARFTRLQAKPAPASPHTMPGMTDMPAGQAHQH